MSAEKTVIARDWLTCVALTVSVVAALIILTPPVAYFALLNMGMAALAYLSFNALACNSCSLRDAAPGLVGMLFAAGVAVSVASAGQFGVYFAGVAVWLLGIAHNVNQDHQREFSAG